MRRRDLLRLLAASPLAAMACRAEPTANDSAQSQTPGGPAPVIAALPDAEIELTAAPATAPLRPGIPTRVWQYSARVLRGAPTVVQPVPRSYLGPTIRLRRGQRVRIHFRNHIGEPSIVHWHGLDVPELADGHPRLAVADGGEYVYDFEVTNRAGTYWYHPHPHMRTAAQVYHGLAGLVLVSDPEEDALALPSGDGELLLVLQDRRFDGENQLVYAGAESAAGGRGPRGRGPGRRGPGGMRGDTGSTMAMMEVMNGWLGDQMLVNGRVQPTIDVDRRTYRVRLLNGSNARMYKLAWSHGAPFTIIGGDGGLLAEPRTQPTLTLAPGQRADLVLDLSAQPAGSEVTLQSVEFPAADVGQAGMRGGNAPVPQGAPLEMATLRVSTTQGANYQVPDRLSTDAFQVEPSAPVRRVPLMFMGMNALIDGRAFDLQGVADSETVAAGSTHVWELVNQTSQMGMMNMAMAHPIHLHGRQFRVLSRSGGSRNALREGISDAGWTDTVLVLPGETVRTQITFSAHPGLYLYHCHILEHEDMGMMRNFRIH